MTKKLIALLLIAALALSLCPAMAEGGVTVTDMTGREITLSEPAARIVALTAADCEILCALGCEDALVGRGEYCDYPASVLDKPSVQSGYETNIEQIIALEPQVVLMATMAQTVEQVEQLIMSVMRRELRAIVWLGALLGAIMGCVNMLLF